MIGDDAFSEAGGVSADDVIDGAGLVTKRGQAGSGAEGAVEHADGQGKRRPALVAITPLQGLAAGEATSVGLKVVQALTRQIHGRFEHAHQEGAKFTIYFDNPEQPVVIGDEP